MLERLPTEILVHLFSFLEYKDLVSCSLVCRWLHDISCQDALWKYQCYKYWLENECPPHVNWKTHFEQWYAEWKRYIHCYRAIRSTWNKIERFMEEHCPSVYNSLQEGVTEDCLDDLEEKSDKKLPLDLRCSYRIHNGQSKTAFGLFGSVALHDHYRSESLVDVHSAFLFQSEIFSHNTISITTCYQTGVTQVMALDNKDGFMPGTIFYPSNEEGYARAFIHGYSFTEWLTKFAEQLDGNEFIVIDQQLYRFQRVPDCKATTGDITVTVRTCFMQELSSIFMSHFCHTYRITMTMNESAPRSASCQLQTRHWIVTDADGHEVQVDGPGVVGEFPILHPGSTFSWVSCTTFSTTTGNMRGHFTMRNLRTGEKMDIVCPTFHMECMPFVDTKKFAQLFT